MQTPHKFLFRGGGLVTRGLHYPPTDFNIAKGQILPRDKGEPAGVAWGCIEGIHEHL